MTYRFLIRQSLALTLAITLISCVQSRPHHHLKSHDSTGRDSVPEGDATKNVAIQELNRNEDADRTSQFNDAEISVRSPEEQIDGFVLHYGFAPQKLILTEKIPLSQMTEVTNPSGEKIYSYRIKRAPKASSVFVTVSAYRGEDTSSPSPVVEIKPEDENSSSARENLGTPTAKLPRNNELFK